MARAAGRETIAFRVDPGEKAALVAAADANGLTLTQLLRWALRAWLNPGNNQHGGDHAET